MNAIDELVDILINFTPEQLENFLSNPVTELILQPARASEFCPQAEPLCS